MIAASPELMAVARRWFRLVRNRDFSALPDLLSQSEALRFIGTSDGESYDGAAVRAGIADYLGEIPGFVDFVETEAEAFECGDTGWAAFTHRITFENRPDVPMTYRNTLVFVLEKGSWKIVQRHGSNPVANIEVLGTPQLAIQALIDAAQQGFALDQREGLASVMFTDIAGSSALAAALGDRAWSPIVTRHFAEVRRNVEAAGGQFVKSLGDGTLSSFPSARAALGAAGDLQRALAARTTEPHLAVRIGLHTGDVVQTQDDFFGNVVNKAARITAMAEPATVLVSDVTRAMVGGDTGYGFTDMGRIELKGLGGDHRIFRLDWRA